MREYDDMQYFPTAEKLVEILCQKTQNTNPLFFRVLVAYYFCKVATMMRAKIKTFDRGELPVNMYAINLAVSGQGKGHSTNIIEDHVINQFKDRFLDSTFPTIAESNIKTIALDRSARKSTDYDDELERVEKEFITAGEMVFSFDSGTTPAVKQMRHKLLMANAGSMNMEIDEIGSNLLSNIDVLNTYLELFDVGKVKQKLLKNTTDNARLAEIEGKTPTNMMLFGTPSKLLNGAKTEEEFYSMLETGYARRCIFGYQTSSTKVRDLTPEQVYDMLTDNSTDQFVQDLSDELYNLADMSYFNKTIDVSKDVSLLIIEYRQQCEALAEKLGEHQEVQKAELSHRYFKAMKLAGSYAFIDNSPEVTEEHLYYAIKLVEDSGQAFENMLTRDRNYVKLAKYISSIEHEITHVDLMEDLPCYKGSENNRRELLNLAIAYGYKNNIIIKKSVNDGIEFLKGEAMKPFDLDRVRVADGTKLAEGYRNEEVKFDELHKMTQKQGIHWVSHHLVDGYRKEDKVIIGCDMVVLDVDDGVSIDTAKLLLQDYKYHIYTTKSHTEQKHRYRVILPLTHRVKLDGKDFKEFMDNIFDWFPIAVDTQTGQRSRKWLSHNGEYFTNDGESLDALMFIPKTSKCDDQKKIIADLGNLSNLERWFVAQTAEGNRSNNLIRYALMLVDAGQDFTSVQNNVLALNGKLPEPLDEAEVMSTIMITVNKAIVTRDTA
jgi:hypothetical protein